MRKSRIGALIAGLFLCVAAVAQSPSPPPPPATPITTAQITFPVFTLNPSPASGVTLGLVGPYGQQTIYYWIATNYTVGRANLVGPFPITNAPNTLTGSNYVSVNPIFPAGVGPASYDVLKTLTPIQPSGACACAVATAVAIGTVTNDQSNSTSAYTVTIFNLVPLTMTIQNEVQSAGISHLILRQNGVFVADLSTTGSAGITGLGTANTIPLWATGTTLGNSLLSQSGSTLLANAGAINFPQNGGVALATTNATNGAFAITTSASNSGNGSTFSVTAGNGASGNIGGNIAFVTGSAAGGGNGGNFTVSLGSSNIAYSQDGFITMGVGGYTDSITMGHQNTLGPQGGAFVQLNNAGGTNNSTYITTGKGAVSGACPVTTPTVYVRSDAVSASTVLYVCWSGGTWTAVTAP